MRTRGCKSSPRFVESGPVETRLDLSKCVKESLRKLIKFWSMPRLVESGAQA
jgi:hypothetical protein